MFPLIHLFKLAIYLYSVPLLLKEAILKQKQKQKQKI